MAEKANSTKRGPKSKHTAKGLAQGGAPVLYGALCPGPVGRGGSRDPAWRGARVPAGVRRYLHRLFG